MSETPAMPPKNWNTCLLRDIVDFEDGRRIPLKQADRDNREGDIPYYGASGIIDNIDAYIFDEPLILVGEDGENLVSRNLPLAFKVSGKIWVNNHAHVLRPRAAVDIDFLTTYLESLDYSGIVSGSAQPKLTQRRLQEVPIVAPPLPEQCKIARILTTLDNLIEKTEAPIAKYQAMKQGMMHDLFTRGIDAHGQLRPPQAEAPELYKESELGWIPTEWFSCKLGAVVPYAEYGISVSLDDGEGVPVLRMNNLNHGIVDVSDVKYSGSFHAKQLLLRDRDVLFNRTNSIDHVGRTSIWHSELAEASFASLVRLLPDCSKLIPEYLVGWLNLPETQIAIRQFATPGVHQVNNNPTNLRRTLIALPSQLSEQSSICSEVQQQDAAIEEENRYLAKLRLLKTGLMQDLLTGKVRVKVDEPEEVLANA